jgi:hypothetical protein
MVKAPVPIVVAPVNFAVPVIVVVPAFKLVAVPVKLVVLFLKFNISIVLVIFKYFPLKLVVVLSKLIVLEPVKLIFAA